MNKSKFVTFIFSTVPGLGHYYLGQKIRGLQMMTIFFGSIFLFTFLRLDFSFPFLLPIIWFFSLFDALEQHRVINENQELVDPPLFHLSTLPIKRQWIGWGLIIIGVYLFLDKLIYRFLDYIYYETFRNLLVAFIFIGAGWLLLSGKKIKINKNNVERGNAE